MGRGHKNSWGRRNYLGAGDASASLRHPQMAPVFYMYDNDYNTMLLSTGYFILALGLHVGPTYAGLYVGYVAYVRYEIR